MSNQGVDDEPDYMSDDFLAKCIPEDIRPGFKRVSSFVTVIVASEIVWSRTIRFRCPSGSKFMY